MEMQKSEVFLMDCKEGLSAAKDKFWDLGIPDPPYGIDGNSHRKNKSRGRLAPSKDYHMALWNQEKPDDEYFELLFKKTKAQLIFGGNYFPQLGTVFTTPRRHEINDWIKEFPKGWIAWDKVNGTTGFNDYELIWTSFKHMPSKIFKFMWNGFMQGASFEKGHIMNAKKQYNEVRIHPAHKPVAIYKYLLKEFGQGRRSVVDTHVGSGSSRIAAYDAGFDYTGFEIEEMYFIGQETRFKLKTAQQSLFQNLRA